MYTVCVDVVKFSSRTASLPKSASSARAVSVRIPRSLAAWVPEFDLRVKIDSTVDVDYDSRHASLGEPGDRGGESLRF